MELETKRWGCSKECSYASAGVFLLTIALCVTLFGNQTFWLFYYFAGLFLMIGFCVAVIKKLQLMRNSRRCYPQQSHPSLPHHTSLQPRGPYVENRLPNRSLFGAPSQQQNSYVNNNNNIGCHGDHQTLDLSVPPPSYQEIRDVEEQDPPAYESLFPKLSCRVDVMIEISDDLEQDSYSSPPSYKDYIHNLSRSKTEV